MACFDFVSAKSHQFVKNWAIDNFFLKCFPNFEVAKYWIIKLKHLTFP